MTTSWVAPLGLALVLVAGCASTRERTARAADRLEHSAEGFAALTCYEPNTACSPDVPAAREFLAETREFRETLDSAGDQQVVFAFQRLWRSYHALRDEVYRLHERELRADLKPTTKAFADVQRHVKTGYSYADTTLYASGGYMFDPYYN